MNKLTKIALSVAVVLGAVATGGSWYTGKQVEARYGELVAQANRSLKSLNAYGIDGELKNVKLERGFFSSDVSYNLEAKINGETLQFNGNDKLFHGPLPLNRLLKGNIVPAMASIETNIAVPEQFKADFAKPELLVGTTTMSYDESFSGDAKIAAFQSAEFPVALSEITGEFDFDKNGNGKFKSTFPQIKVQNAQQNDEVIFEQLAYDIEIKGNSPFEQLHIGEFDLKAKAIIFRSTDLAKKGNEFAVRDIHSKGENKIDGSTYLSDAEIDAKITLKDHGNEMNVGKLKADVFTAVDAQTANDLAKVASDPELLESDAGLQTVLAMFAKPVKFQIKTISLENGKGKSDLSLVINSDGVNPNNLGDLRDVLNAFKQSKLAVNISVPAAEETLKQMLSLNPKTKANAAEMAKAQMQEVVAKAQANKGLAVVDGDKIKLKLELDQGKVTLNGREVPEQEIQGALFLIMLGLSGL